MPTIGEENIPQRGKNNALAGGGPNMHIDNIKTDSGNQSEKRIDSQFTASKKFPYESPFEFVSDCTEAYPNCQIKDEPASPINASEFLEESHNYPGEPENPANYHHAFSEKRNHDNAGYNKSPETTCDSSEIINRPKPQYRRRHPSDPKKRVYTKHRVTPMEEANAFGNLLCRNKELICDICGYNKTSRWRMVQHMSAAHNFKQPEPEVLLQCTICQKTYDHRFKLRKHIRRHTAQHLCGYCGKIFTDKSTLTVHLRIMHTGDGPNDYGNLLCRNKELTCDICGHKLKARWRMMQHMATIHKYEEPVPDTVYPCHLCPKSFDHRVKLQSHVKRHTSKFNCEYCGKIFTDMGNLKVHLRVHTGDRPYDCSVCGKLFATTSAHRLHMKNHLDDKPYKCDECDKSFTNLKSLQSHKKSHTSDRPFVCEICGKAFARRPALKLHMNTHTGHTPYGCMFCNRSFRSPGARRSHETNVHKTQ